MAKYEPKIKSKNPSKWPDLPFQLGREGAELVWGDKSSGRKSGPKTFGASIKKKGK